MYDTIRSAIVTALRGDAGLDSSTIDGYEHEINIVASHLTNRLRQSVRQLEDDAVAIGLDRSEVRAALIRVGLIESADSVRAQERPVPALSGGVVPQQGAVSSKVEPRLPDPRRETPRRSFLQRLFGG